MTNEVFQPEGFSGDQGLTGGASFVARESGKRENTVNAAYALLQTNLNAAGIEMTLPDIYGGQLKANDNDLSFIRRFSDALGAVQMAASTHQKFLNDNDALAAELYNGAVMNLSDNIKRRITTLNIGRTPLDSIPYDAVAITQVAIATMNELVERARTKENIMGRVA